jgi:hypothetical protein
MVIEHKFTVLVKAVVQKRVHYYPQTVVCLEDYGKLIIQSTHKHPLLKKGRNFKDSQLVFPALGWEITHHKEKVIE